MQIDTTALARLRDSFGGDAEDLAEFIDDFAEIAPDLHAQMVAGLSGGDVTAVKIAAHSLKSNARDMGATALGDMCAALEAQAGAGDIVDGTAQVDAIGAAQVEAVAALKALDLDAV